MFLSPQDSCWNLIPNVMVFGGGAFGRWLGHGGGALMNGISALIKEAPESSLTLPPYEDTARRLPSIDVLKWNNWFE